MSTCPDTARTEGRALGVAARTGRQPLLATAVLERAPVEGSMRETGRVRRWLSRWGSSVPLYFVLADLGAIATAAWATRTPEWPDTAVMVVLALLVLAGSGTYRSRLTLSVLDDLSAICVAALMGGVGQLAWLTLAGHEPPAAGLLLRVVAVAGALTAGRAVAYAGVRAARRHGLARHRTLVLGAGDLGCQLVRAMLAHPEYGLEPAGMLDATTEGHDDLPAPLLGTYADLDRTIRRHRVSEVIVAFLDQAPGSGTDDRSRDADLLEAVHACDRLGCEIFCVPRFYEVRRRGRDTDELWGLPLVRAHRATWRSGSWRVKRLLDVLVAAGALILLSPILLLVGLAVRVGVGPDVLFRQERVGLDGRRFTLLKFRSIGPAQDPDAPVVWSLDGDPSLGRVGRLIRATSLDELPQLINILRGEMSLVGPRPERPVFVEEFTRRVPRYTARHRTPAGLTGWAQVNGLRGNTSIEERVRFDNYYIQNWSLWFDVKILARTLSAVLLGKGS